MVKLKVYTSCIPDVASAISPETVSVTQIIVGSYYFLSVYVSFFFCKTSFFLSFFLKIWNISNPTFFLSM